MRKVIDLQMKFGGVLIENIKFDLKCRDEITKILIGLKSIYCNEKTRSAVFFILKDMIPQNIDTKNGRHGMDLWKILVLGVIKLGCDWDYDKLHNISNNHRKIREMLGHIEIIGDQIWDDQHIYKLQTLRDNISLFKPEILDKINEIIVKQGHATIGKKEDERLNGSCDSSVVETDVHFPTDTNLLFDAIRKTIEIIMQMCKEANIEGWREGKGYIKKIKKLFSIVRRIKHSTSKNSEKRAKKEQAIIESHQAYIDYVEKCLDKVKLTIKEMRYCSPSNMARALLISNYIEDVERQLDQIKRRVIEGKKIPHEEKVFSIFERHTEWIKRGKAGILQELGLRVCFLKDQYGFILHHKVMEKTTDEKVAVSMVKETQEKFPELSTCSFDKGFHTPNNQIELNEILDEVVLPQKGRLSKKRKEIEGSDEFVNARHKHSAVESSINGLQKCGLKICRDHGMHGFKRYVALGVLARNIHVLGAILQEKEKKQIKKMQKAA